MDLSLIQDYVTSLLLHLVRVGAFMAVLPFLGKHPLSHQQTVSMMG